MSEPGNGFGVCKDCGAARWLETEYNECYHCNGSGRDLSGADPNLPCIFCDHGEVTTDTVMCNCEEDYE